MAREIHGVPSSPRAATAIDDRYLPAPPREFGGQINGNAAQSKSYWPARVVQPNEVPNILLIVRDEARFGAVGRERLPRACHGERHRTELDSAA
jgi:hypothetical protein